MENESQEELMQLIELWTCQRSAKECESLLVAAGVPCTPYLTVEQAMQSDQAQARGACTSIADAAGSYRIPHAPFQMPGLDVAPRVKVPELGEHTQEVLSRFLRAEDQRIAE